MRRRIWLPVAMMVIPAVALAGLGWFVWRLTSISLPLTSFVATMIVGLPAVLLAVPGLFVLRRALKDRAIHKQLIKARGLICPWCTCALETQAAGQSSRCQACNLDLDAQEVRDFWTDYVLNPSAAFTWKANERARGSATPALIALQAQQWIKGSPARSIAWIVIVWGLAGAIVGLLFHQSIVVGMVEYLPLALLMAGMMLVSHGWKRRVGDSRHCVACEHQLPPDGPWPQRCPECGASLHAGLTTIEGARVWRPSLIASGSVITALGLALMIMPLANRSLKSRILPTSALIAQVTSPRAGFTIDQWAELSTRSLTRDQELSLAQGLLDARKASGLSLSRDADAWFCGMMTNGSLPGELVERYYREAMVLRIDAPNVVRVGEEIFFEVRADYRHTPFAALSPAVVFGECVLGDGSQVRSRALTAIAGILLQGSVRESARRRGEELPSYSAKVTLDKPGEARLFIRAWIVFVPNAQANDQIEWENEGAPRIAGTAIWSSEVALEKVIDVRQ